MDLQSYTASISPDEPCGPDLYETEPGFAAFLDSCEESLPEVYSKFDRKEIAFSDIFKQIDGYMKRTKDLRLLVMAAQYSALNGQLHRFADNIRMIRALLEAHWEHAHPSGANLNFMERMGALESLALRPRVLLPLDDAALFKTKVSGPVSFRAIEVAKGLKTARPDEQPMSEGKIEAAITSGELTAEDIGELLLDLAEIPRDLEQISAICRERLAAVGAKTEQAPSFDDICRRVRDIAAEMNGRFGNRVAPDTASAKAAADVRTEGAAAERPSVAAATATSISNAAQAKLVLKALDDYFSLREPSHPALFLVREAHGLVGKSFLDALKILMPQRFDSVKLLLGTSGLQITNARLQDLNQNGGAESGELEGFETPVIDSRSVAISNINAVRIYFSKNEPTSPIPLLLDEAQSLGDVSFTSLVGIVTRSGNS